MVRLRFLGDQLVVSVESYVVLAVLVAKIIMEEKSDKLTRFRSVKAAHSHFEHVAVIFLGQIKAICGNA